MNLLQGSPELTKKPLPTVSVQICVLTYKRPQMLRETLASLMAQTPTSPLATVQEPLCCATAELDVAVLIIDNDAGLSGKAVVLECAQQSRFPIRYVSYPQRGIAGARNQALIESQRFDLVAFIDDDEIADANWLVRLVDTMFAFQAAVVTGPVQPDHENSPLWIRRGRFFDPVDRPMGADVPFVATNNVLLRADIVREFRFDPRFDSTGGEDTDFFLRIRNAGHRLIWARDAVVTEKVPVSRANLRWLLQRARSDANRYTRACLYSAPGPATVARRFLVACAGFCNGLARLLLLPFGRHYAVRGLQLISRAAGTLSGLSGRRDLYYGPKNG